MIRGEVFRLRVANPELDGTREKVLDTHAPESLYMVQRDFTLTVFTIEK